MKFICQVLLVGFVVLFVYSGLLSAFEPHEAHGPLGFNHACKVLAFCGGLAFCMWKAGAFSELNGGDK